MEQKPKLYAIINDEHDNFDCIIEGETKSDLEAQVNTYLIREPDKVCFLIINGHIIPFKTSQLVIFGSFH